MENLTMVELNQYLKIAMVQSPDCEELQILNNESTHFLVVEVGHENLEQGKVLASFGYYARPENDYFALKHAFQFLNDRLARICDSVNEEQSGDNWLDTCPGCQAAPGDGVTAECNNDAGCGYWKSLAKGGAAPRQ